MKKQQILYQDNLMVPGALDSAATPHCAYYTSKIIRSFIHANERKVDLTTALQDLIPLDERTPCRCSWWACQRKQQAEGRHTDQEIWQQDYQSATIDATGERGYDNGAIGARRDVLAANDKWHETTNTIQEE
jgi:hypothetical protein